MPAMMKEHRDKPFTVRDLIEHLTTLNTDLPVWFQMGGQEHFYPANSENAVQYTVSEKDGTGAIEVCIIGDVP